MTHESGGSSTRDRKLREDRRDHGVPEHDPYEQHERETRDMPERHGALEGPHRFLDDEWDMDIHEGYR